ncbi:MAG: class I SAM-dependent methyltransferase [Saprospiraceae bacterium]
MTRSGLFIEKIKLKVTFRIQYLYFASMHGYYTFAKFIEHRFRGRRWDSFHSPFLFRLMTYCCDDRIHSEAFKEIEGERKKMIRSKEKISRQDFGAGKEERYCKENQKISSIAKKSLSLPFQCRFLYRLMEYINPVSMIEFGTCLGISSAYIAKGVSDGQLISIEGDMSLYRIAHSLFEKLSIKNIKVINSSFENFLTEEEKNIGSLDFIFLDGNHRSEALIEYYQHLKPHFTSETILMVDDIYWSSDMNAGWKLLTKMPEVRQSVDCFHFGLLFFREDFINKQNHVVRLPVKAILR